MAEEPQYSNKRKYDDSPAPASGATPPPRRPTGFSSAPTAAPPVASPSPDSTNGGAAVGAYNSVVPPADEIQLAKQRAQEIAARLFSSAEAKRPRVENGGSDDGADKGFGSSPADLAQKYPVQQYGSSQGGMAASLSGSYGYHGANKKIEIPNGRVGVIIGKSGETIKYLQHQSGAKIQVTRDMDTDPNSQTRMVELMGTPEQISRAEQLINDVLSEAEAGGAGVATSRRFTPGQAGGEQFVMKVPNNKVGLIIGKGGETIKNMQARSGARIQVIPLHLPPGDTSTERTVQIDGTQEQIDAAKQLVDEVCSENRARNTSMGGGYTQQGYRPPRPPTSWGAPGMPPMQQPGYGYMQPGAYPGPPPQYNTSQPPYGGYPSQPTSGWDQSTPQNQQNAPSGGYDYYNQQASQQQQPAPGSSAPGDNTSYNYGQPLVASYSQGYGETNYSHPPSGQQHGYGQDGYGGYHVPPSQTGYGPPPTSQPNYDQSQGYGSAGGYPNQDSSAPSSQQAPPPVQPSTGTQPGAYTGQPPSTTTPPYASQGTTQAGYGMPPTSQPGYGGQPPAQPGYSQSGSVAHPGYGPLPGQKPPTAQPGYPQGPPTSQAGYMAPSQPGYPHTQAPPAQSSYGQSDPAVHRGPPGYGSAAPHSSYGQQQSYGAPPAASQTGYPQQQPQPYGDSYGSSAYTQPSAYSSDNPSGGSAHGGYDGTAAQSVQSAVAKASPKA